MSSVSSDAPASERPLPTKYAIVTNAVIDSAAPAR